MAAADEPKNQIQASPPSPPTSVTSAAPAVVSVAPTEEVVKAPRPRMAAEDFNAITDRLDLVLIVLVLLFAFLAASFAIRNSDFFQFLATGRLIAQGQYEFGKDPFSFSTQDVRWVNHSWMYSYFLYLIHSLGDTGDVVLIVLKAVAIAGVAGSLLALARKPGQRWLVPGVCTAVAVLAISARALLQPVVVSYLFLALTLLVLRWPHLRPVNAAGPRSFRCFWLLIPLFLLWVNFDQWCILGPIVVALYWVGEYVQDVLATDRKTTRPPGELRTLGYAMLASAAACLLNPHHVFALTLPAQLGLTESATALGEDIHMKILYLSPLDKLYWTQNNGLSAAGLSYFVLLAAGIVSFFLAYNTLRYWRILLFVVFGLLSLYHARAIPFFAIVAGPIASLNFLDFAAARLGENGEPDRVRQWWMLGRVVALLAVVALTICTIPGWTQAQPYSQRHVSWKVIPDESLVRTCGKMADWRRDGQLAADARWFNLSPDVANYMAWYCPGERGFFDLRVGLYDGKTAKDYVDVRAEVLGFNPPKPGEMGQPQQPPPEKWPGIVANQRADYLIVYFPDPQILNQPLARLLADPDWTPLSLDGHTLVFARNKDHDAAARLRNERLRFDLTEAAFGLQALKAPFEGLTRLLVKREWYTDLWQEPPPRSQAADDAKVYITYNNLLAKGWQTRKLNDFVRLLHGWWGLTSPTAAVVLGHTKLPYLQIYLANQDPPSPAELYVALRGLRQSLKSNPDDAQTYLLLGQVYMTLFFDTRERQLTSGPGFYQVSQIRQAQITWALQRALQLNPDLKEAHMVLAAWYGKCRDPQMNVPCYIAPNLAVPFLDMELKHLKEWLRIAQQNQGKAKGDSEVVKALRDAEDTEIKRLEEDIQKLDTEVRRRFDQLTINGAGKPVLHRAIMALQMELGGEALTILREASSDDLVVTQNGEKIAVGFIMEMKLLLATGDREVTADLLDPKLKAKWQLLEEYRVPGYDWFRLLYAAANGNYDEADDALAAMSEFALHDDGLRSFWQGQFGMAGKPDGKPVLASRQMMALFIGGIKLNEMAIGGQPWLICRPPSYIPLVTTQFLTTQAMPSLLGLEADYPALRGWMALEAGDTVAARKHFNASLLATIPNEPELALSAAAGLAVPGRRPREQQGLLRERNDLARVRSLPLAKLGLYYLDNAAARRR